jgi:hypothetical protein
VRVWAGSMITHAASPGVLLVRSFLSLRRTSYSHAVHFYRQGTPCKMPKGQRFDCTGPSFPPAMNCACPAHSAAVRRHYTGGRLWSWTTTRRPRRRPAGPGDRRRAPLARANVP